MSRYRYDQRRILAALEQAAGPSASADRHLAEMAGVSRRTIIRWRQGTGGSARLHRVADRVEMMTGVPISLLERDEP